MSPQPNIMQIGTRKKTERKSCSDIYSLIFYTIPDCNDCSETTDAVRRKQEKDQSNKQLKKKSERTRQNIQFTTRNCSDQLKHIIYAAKSKEFHNSVNKVPFPAQLVDLGVLKYFSGQFPPSRQHKDTTFSEEKLMVLS